MSFSIKNMAIKVVEREADRQPVVKEPEKMKLVEKELIFDENDRKWKLVKKTIIPGLEN